MRRDPRVDAALRDLEHVVYADRADDFVRFLADPADDAMRALVNTVVNLGEDGREHFRRSLTGPGADRLRLFALRRTLAARREGLWGLVDEAMDAVALLRTLEEVPWSSWVEGALYVARQLGRDLEEIARRFDEMANEVAARRFRAALEAMDRVERFDQCHMVEVTTDHGTGFIEILVFHDRTRSRYASTVRAADNVVTFAPTTNLAQLASSLADALDGAGSRSGPIAQDQLAASLFNLELRGSYLATAGCLSFVADDLQGGPARSVFVAECLEGADVEALVNAASTADQVAIGDGARLIVFVRQPNFDAVEDDETNDELADTDAVVGLVADSALTHSVLRRGPAPTWFHGTAGSESPTTQP